MAARARPTPSLKSPVATRTHAAPRSKFPSAHGVRGVSGRRHLPAQPAERRSSNAVARRPSPSSVSREEPTEQQKDNDKFQQMIKTCEGRQSTYTAAQLPDCEGCAAVDCVLGEWSYWGGCDCKTKTQKRTRVKEENAKCGGKLCDGATSESKACDEGAISECDAGERQDCKYNEWTEWGACSKDCDEGVSTRVRTVKTFAKGEDSYGNELKCEETEEHVACNDATCPIPINCQYSAFGDWSECSAECDGGQKVRTREILSGPADGGSICHATDLEEIAPCNEHPCTAKEIIDCQLSAWDSWGYCNAPNGCGGGLQMRSRALETPGNDLGKPCEGKLQEFQECDTEPCADLREDCVFGEWSAWGGCSGGCNGTMERTRQIAAHQKHGGKPCEGHEREVQPCNTGAEGNCDIGKGDPVDCQFTEWGYWESCTQECDGGQHSRRREIAVPAAYGGKPCSGSLNETAECNAQPCNAPVDCALGEWEDWNPCSKSCGTGWHRRVRQIVSQPRYGGKHCEAHDTVEIENCHEKDCEAQPVRVCLQRTYTRCVVIVYQALKARTVLC